MCTKIFVLIYHYVRQKMYLYLNVNIPATDMYLLLKFVFFNSRELRNIPNAIKIETNIGLIQEKLNEIEIKWIFERKESRFSLKKKLTERLNKQDNIPT